MAINRKRERDLKQKILSGSYISMQFLREVFVTRYKFQLICIVTCRENSHVLSVLPVLTTLSLDMTAALSFINFSSFSR